MNPATSRRERIKAALSMAHMLRQEDLLNAVQMDLFKEIVFTQPDSIVLKQEYVLSSKLIEEEVHNFAKCLFNKIFENCTLDNAHIIATNYTDEIDEVDTHSLVYGEVDFDSFAEVLRVATNGISRHKKFVDLGHGTGRAIVAVDEYTCYFGIEILKGLYHISREIIDRLKDTIRPLYTRDLTFDLHHGSFLTSKCHWTDADLVFANSTCFHDDLLYKISVMAKDMQPGARLITFTTSLRSEYFKIIYKKRLQMSWGPATVYIHERLPENEVSHGVYDKSSRDMFRNVYMVDIDNMSIDTTNTNNTSVGSNSIGFSMIPLLPERSDNESSLATSPAQTLNTIYSNGRESHWEPDTPQLRQWAKAELERIETEQDDKFSEDELTIEEYLSEGDDEENGDDEASVEEVESGSAQSSSDASDDEEDYVPHDTRNGSWYNNQRED